MALWVLCKHEHPSLDPQSPPKARCGSTYLEAQGSRWMGGREENPCKIIGQLGWSRQWETRDPVSYNIEGKDCI